MGNVTPLRHPKADERLSRTFSGPGDFEAIDGARAWLEARGFSIGPLQGGSPVGILLGDCVIAKWNRLSPEDRDDLHGVITADLGDFRHGPVIVAIRPDVHSSVIDAFTAPEAEAPKVVALRTGSDIPGAELADAHEVIDMPAVFGDADAPRYVRLSAGRDRNAQRKVEGTQ